MLSGVQTGNGSPHDTFNIRGIVRVRTNRKDDIFMQRQLAQNFAFILEWGQGTCSLMKHTRRWACSWYFFPACCLLHFVVFFSLDAKKCLLKIVNCNPTGDCGQSLHFTFAKERQAKLCPYLISNIAILSNS